MVNYREIIRLKSQDYSNTRVATSTGSSRNTVAEVWQLTQDKDLKWPIPDELTNPDLQAILYLDRACTNGRKLPDFETIHNELANPVSRFLCFGRSTASSAEMSRSFLISILSLTTSIMLMPHPRKRRCALNASPVNSPKWTGREKRLRSLMKQWANR